ncbi:hypothetical protein Rsub_12782 [Raphidocelis subcapitata]|uniref:Uncharacterized protein n=1 Tax=Raphidocelis subcapitata TaxID=307507 RepID=A0A2V0PPB7_9CHLO|nr:hypothetical protein Rsub_12782 [Raphidocelis subcapitata]|eukprot:GBG00004.1 hypothetical protein Rsub_12782 [Raphidocelis subcapitata]
MDVPRATGAHHAPPDQNAQPASARDLWREARKLLSDLEERLLERRFDKEALEREVKARKSDLQAVVDDIRQLQGERELAAQSTAAAAGILQRLDTSLAAVAQEASQLAVQLQLLRSKAVADEARLAQTRATLEAGAQEQAEVMGRGRPEAEKRAAAQAELARIARRAADAAEAEAAARKAAGGGGAQQEGGADGGGAGGAVGGPLGGLLQGAARLQEAAEEQCLPAEWLKGQSAGEAGGCPPSAARD